jgi:hypothetical protein
MCNEAAAWCDCGGNATTHVAVRRQCGCTYDIDADTNGAEVRWNDAAGDVFLLTAPSLSRWKLCERLHNNDAADSLMTSPYISCGNDAEDGQVTFRISPPCVAADIV